MVNGEAIHQANPMNAMATTKNGKPTQAWLCTPANMWLVFCRRPVINTMTPCATIKNMNQQSEMKWMERAAWRFNTFPRMPDRLEIDGLCMRPVRIETGAAMNTVMK